jgi:hypothetical protein
LGTMGWRVVWGMRWCTSGLVPGERAMAYVHTRGGVGASIVAAVLLRRVLDEMGKKKEKQKKTYLQRACVRM